MNEISDGYRVSPLCLDSEEEAAWINELRAAPRINVLLSDFEDIAAGRKGRPIHRVPLDYDLLGRDSLACSFGDTMMGLAGHFEEHIAASVPWIREERARYGAALLLHGLDIADREQRPALVYTTSGAEGTEARALATLAGGRIETLSCSPNEANRQQFFARGAPSSAHFYHGPYYEITPGELARRGLPQFGEGCDVIVEETTLQMYHKKRYEQIALIRRNLKPGGILMLLEKLNHDSPEEYLAREQQKDEEFKSLYFGSDQIQQKRTSILTHMGNMQVSLPELAEALDRHFSAAVITYNSGNFYNIAASDDPDNLATFVSRCLPPAVPQAFMYCQLPEILFSPPGFDYFFREPIPS